jgi:TPR repeat protein
MTELVCPACGSTEVRIAAVHGNDGLIHRFFYHPYRCRNCRHRYWLRSNPRIVAAIVFFVLLIAVAALSAWLGGDGSSVRYTASNDLVGSLHKRAKARDAEAQVQLGKMYEEGDGILRDSKEAVRWFGQAANAGNREGQYLYALALMDGRGVVQDYQAAFKWLEAAAKGGHPAAEFQLGRMYYKGMGIPVDKAKAYIWFNLAAARGNEEAARIRDVALRQIPPSEVNEAQNAARKLHDEMSGLAPGTDTKTDASAGQSSKETTTSLKLDSALTEK